MNKPRLDDPATWTAEEHLYHLFLFHAAKGLDQTIQACVKENRDHRDFLVRLLDVERVGRYESRVKRLIRAAKFPALKTIDDFDWAHPATIPKQSILTLARSLDFISKHEHLIFIGPGGVGKTHLAISLGLAACQRRIRTLYTTAADMINTLVASQVDHSLVRSLKRFTAPGLLIIDELGCAPRSAWNRPACDGGAWPTRGP